jgi:hypothetical protein
MLSRSFALAALVLAPQLAAAQFTTFIAPKNKVQDSIKAEVVAVQKAQADSITRLGITNMKAWVDSAAGIPTPPLTDSTVAKTTVTMPPAPKPKPVIKTDSAVFRNGIRAPATASNLPLIALLGLITMSVGGLLVRVPARQRARRP